MSILTIILVLVAVGLVLWAVNSFLPLDPVIRKILNITVIILVIFWLLKAFQIWQYLSSARI